MAEAARRNARGLVVAQALLVWSLLDDKPPDLDRFIATGELGTARPMRVLCQPLVDRKVAEIMANGGKLIVE